MTNLKMPLKPRELLGFLAAIILVPSSARGFEAKVTSPEGAVTVGFALTESGEARYHVVSEGRQVVFPSRLGFKPGTLEGFTKVGDSRRSVRESWSFAFGERSENPDAFDELRVELKHGSGLRLDIVLRAYDEGAAVRYEFPTGQANQAALHFDDEHTEFCLPKGAKAYEEHGTEGPYQLSPVSDIRPYCERPLTVVLPEGGYAAIGEAGNLDYARMLLSPLANREGALVSALGGRTTNTESEHQPQDSSVSMIPGTATPWRVVLVGKTPGELLENNYLFLNLSPPCRLQDTSWIKPGKVMRAELTTTSGKAVIDFAETAGLDYVHFDAGWYGLERADKSDATQIDPERSDELDLRSVVEYGEQHDVGVLVYVNRIELKRRLSAIYPLYEQWGLKGIKYGFVPVGPQSETTWLTEAIAKAAEHKLMINVHDGFRANGINRTYPNLMTVEGIRGNERMPTAEHNCTLPFTRYLCGIGDYTVCYYSNRIQTTHAHQLAMAVVSFSPLQWIFWYDQPDKYRGEPEIEFFREVPTVWDETRVLEGEIGVYATIARRSGDAWFIGMINADEPRQTELALDFLNARHAYDATLYYDDPNVKTRTQVGIRRQAVTASSKLTIEMPKSGGAALWIRPKSGE